MSPDVRLVVQCATAQAAANTGSDSAIGCPLKNEKGECGGVPRAQAACAARFSTSTSVVPSWITAPVWSINCSLRFTRPTR